jgi:hypothetical protein
VIRKEENVEGTEKSPPGSGHTIAKIKHSGRINRYRKLRFLEPAEGTGHRVFEVESVSNKLIVLV